MKATWKGSISFGLVNIPVQLYPATQERSIDLDYLRKKDLAPVGYKRVTKTTGEEVPFMDIVRGYKFGEDDYVVLSDEDLKHANVKKTQLIDILDFVDEKDIDSKYYVRPYYIEADKKAHKAYALLKRALEKTKKVGIAKFVLTTREHLALIKPEGDFLMLIELRFQSEIRDTKTLTVPQDEKVSAKEMAMAEKLIDHLAVAFRPSSYKDTYTDELKELIEKKHKGHKVRPQGSAPTPTAVPDLMKKLQESLTHKRSHIN